MFTEREYRLMAEGLELTISVLMASEFKPNEETVERFGARIGELRTLKNKILRLGQ